jgi:hypothetical protein
MSINHSTTTFDVEVRKYDKESTKLEEAQNKKINEYNVLNSRTPVTEAADPRLLNTDLVNDGGVEGLVLRKAMLGHTGMCLQRVRSY